LVASLTLETSYSDVAIEIGGLCIRLCVDDPGFVEILKERYAGFVTSPENAKFEFKIDVAPPGMISPAEDVQVVWDSRRWTMKRGDFCAEWDPSARHGLIRQTANSYSLDSVLRILHTLLLAREGGFLLHAASAVRNGRAFLFTGPSGAGKTTIARLSPPDATLFTDEISYVRRKEDQYCAFGTPFTGELARLGENLSAPIAGVYLLAKGPENKVEPLSPTAAACALLENILFFAQDPELVKLVFQAACDFSCRVPICRLTFAPDARVWELIV
jgi:hypothetical protein